MSYREGTSAGVDFQRHVVGFVVSTFTAGLVASGLVALDVIQREGSVAYALVLFIGFPALAMFAGIGGLLLGVPFSVLLARLRLETPWSYALAGFLLGTAIAAILFTSEYRDTVAHYAKFGGLPGAAWGLTWWFSTRRPGGQQ